MSNTDKYKGEKVYVIPRSSLLGIEGVQGFQLLGEDLIQEEIIGHPDGFLMDRGAAEIDPNYKQIIPYCIFFCGDKVLNYTRGKSGNESRLHSKISVGVGGHINDDGFGFYDESVNRELQEELDLNQEDIIGHQMIGILNDNTALVSQVHLGVVHLIQLTSENVTAKEDCLANLTFTNIKELNGPLYDRLEGWSQFIVRYLASEE
jgi:predicted NUDIX family phosphoesterase